MVTLDAGCAWINPSLVLAALVVALLDLILAAKQWAVVHPAPPTLVRIVADNFTAGRCPPNLVPDLRDMAGRD